MEQEYKCTPKTWAIRKGFIQGVAANFHDALEENWYSQLNIVHTADSNTTPIQILDHLNSQWCLLDIYVKKNLRMAHYTDWEGK
jgi:hypothetical protein